MFSDLGDFRCADFEIWIQSLDNRLALEVIVALAHYADGDKAQLPCTELAGGELAEGRYQKFIPERTDMLFDQFVQGAGRVGHLASHQPPFPGRPVRIKQGLQEMIDQATESLLR